MFDKPTTAERKTLNQQYLALKEEVKGAVSYGWNSKKNSPKRRRIWSDNKQGGIVNAYYRRPILVFYLHDRLEVMVQSYHGNISHILDELINVSIQAYSANTLVAQ